MKFRFIEVAIYLHIITVYHVKSTQAGFTLEQGIPHFNTKPYFLQSQNQNITSLQGQSAYISCRVAQLGDKKVSWIRARDLHVLTSGFLTFASDERFIPIHQDRSENWTLHLRYSQIRDSGEYQCQINSKTKKSMSFYLTVVEATSKISGSAQRYVKAGSSIRLVCKTSSASPQPGLLYWYRDNEVLVANEFVSITNNFTDDILSSTLVIHSARKPNSGNYTCWPTKFQPHSVIVHVIPDEEPAAMSDGTLGSLSGSDSSNSSSNCPKTLSLWNGIKIGGSYWFTGHVIYNIVYEELMHIPFILKSLMR